MSTGMSRVCCDSGGGGASLIHQASRTLSDAEIRTMVSTPPAIMGAPSAGLATLLLGGTLLSSIAVPYSNVSTSNAAPGGDGALIFSYGEFWDDDALPFWDSGPGNGSLSSIIEDGIYLLFGNPIYRHTGLTGTNAFQSPYRFDRGDTVSAGIWLQVGNKDASHVPLGDFTGGDAANEILINLHFLVWNLTMNRLMTTAESGWDETTRTFA